MGIGSKNADFVRIGLNGVIRWTERDLISRFAVEWADKNLLLPKDRELFALYIRDHNKQFNVISCKNDVDLSHHTWTVDEPEDVGFMQSIFDELYRDGVLECEMCCVFLRKLHQNNGSP